MHIRNYEPADRERLIKIVNNANKDSYEYIPLTPKSLENWIQDSSLQILIAEDQEFKGAIIAERGWPAESEGVTISLVGTSETDGSAAIERALIDECERQSHATSTEIALPIGHENTPRYLNWGFRLDDGLLHLTRTLEEMPPQPPLMKGATLRVLEEGEEEEFIELVNKSYGRPRLTAQHLNAWRRDDPDFNYDSIHLVEYQNRLIATGVSRRDLEYNEYYHRKRGYLGPSGTLPEFRGRGLNKAVNWHCMNHVRENGMDSVSLYTDEENFAVQKLTHELGYTVVYHWKHLRRQPLSRDTRF